MYILHTFLIVIRLSTISNHAIEVIDSGLMQVRRQDIGLIFYVTVHHQGKVPQRIMTKMVECCEKITDAETDCSVIDIYGGDMGVIQTGETQNLTLFYPNLYAYNRKGSCLVDIWHRIVGTDQSNEIRHRIDFDTTLGTEQVPDILVNYYAPEKILLCETPDLDPFDNCYPVNCLNKYSGRRNFYSAKWKRCMKVPTCVADPTKELPDVAYVPVTNMCRDLEHILTKEDAKLLTAGMISAQTLDFQPHVINVRCHHGHLDAKTGLCICDRGWKSEPFDAESYNPAVSVYQMCNIRCNSVIPSETVAYKLLPSLMGILLAIWLAITVLCCEKYGYYCYAYKRGDRTLTEQEVLYFPVSHEYCCTKESSQNRCSKDSITPSCILPP